jgi:tetraacyldisaccharide 4'-kinase
MHFKNIYLRSFRLFLFPLAVLYGLIVVLRNWLYDRRIIKSVSFNLPIITVGNLSVGGTGKSPMVDYLVSILKKQYPLATLSRGYKRRTSGYLLAQENTDAIEIGDEPMQFHLTHPDIAVAVGEKRIEAIPQLLYDRPDTRLIILDDAFQHREINTDFNILLTEYSNLYTRDFYLPTGDLRDQISSARRARIIIVTKCPSDLSEDERFRIMKEIAPRSGQSVFFTSIEYKQPYHIVTRNPLSLSHTEEILLICGIANPEPLTDYIHEKTNTYEAIFYSDHHLFSIDDIYEMKRKFSDIRNKEKRILTTEKDAVRLVKYKEYLADLPFYVIPITVHFLFGQAKEFADIIQSFPRDFYKKQAEEIVRENELEESISQ